MYEGKTQKLIIVSGEKEIVYAELLSSLISINDNNTESNQFVATKAGSLDAVVWPENTYNDNKIQLSSNNKIIFVGKTKATEPFVVSIRFNKDLEEFGIKLGWLGSKAIIYVEPDKLLGDKNLYDEFYKSYVELSKKYDDSIIDTEAIKKAKHSENLINTLEKGTQAVGNFFGRLFNNKKEEALPENVQDKDGSVITESQNNEIANFFDFGAKIEAGNLIPDQLFRYAILNFYLNHLTKFLGINNE